MVTEQAWNVKKIMAWADPHVRKSAHLLLHFRPVGGSRETLIKSQSQIYKNFYT